MKYECNWCNHTRPCVVEYSGSNECKPDRCMISPEQAGAFELVEDHECEWERSEILDIELKAAQKKAEAPETIDNKSSLKLPEWEKIVDFVDGGGIIGGNNWDGRMWTAGHIVYDIMVGNIKL